MEEQELTNVSPIITDDALARHDFDSIYEWMLRKELKKDGDDTGDSR